MFINKSLLGSKMDASEVLLQDYLDYVDTLIREMQHGPFFDRFEIERKSREDLNAFNYQKFFISQDCVSYLLFARARVRDAELRDIFGKEVSLEEMGVEKEKIPPEQVEELRGLGNMYVNRLLDDLQNGNLRRVKDMHLDLLLKDDDELMGMSREEVFTAEPTEVTKKVLDDLRKAIPKGDDPHYDLKVASVFYQLERMAGVEFGFMVAALKPVYDKDRRQSVFLNPHHEHDSVRVENGGQHPNAVKNILKRMIIDKYTLQIAKESALKAYEARMPLYYQFVPLHQQLIVPVTDALDNLENLPEQLVEAVQEMQKDAKMGTGLVENAVWFVGAAVRTYLGKGNCNSN